MKLKTLLVALGVLAASSAASQADTLADVKARGKLICGTQSTLKPFSYMDTVNKVVIGYEVDLCTGLAESLGVPVEFKLLSSEARIPELMQGRVDVVAAQMTYTPARAEQLDFSSTYLREPFMVIVREDSGIKDFSGLASARFGSVKGSLMERVVQEKFPNASITSFEDQATNFIALIQGKFQAVASRESSLRALQGNAGKDGTALNILDEPLLEQSVGFCVRKGETAMVAAMNDYLASLETSGKGREIFDRWFGKDTDYKMEPVFKFGDPVDQ